MINFFDEQAYLKANMDISNAIADGTLKDLRTHLEAEGLKEIKEGSRKFHNDFEPFDEDIYLKLLIDVKEAINKGNFNSGFEHFCEYGYESIIKKVRPWKKALKSINKTPNDSYGYIDSIENMQIKGWAGSSIQAESKVSLFINMEHIGDVIPDIERADIKEYANALGFKLEFDRSLLLNLFAQMEEVTIRMKIADTWLDHEYMIEKIKWYDSVNETFTKDSFLEFLPLFDAELGKALNLNNIIDALTLFTEYNLDKTLPKIRNGIIQEINKKKASNKDEREKLYRFLLEHHDILLEVSKGLYLSSSPQLLSLVNQVLNTINHQDAHQIVSNAVGDKDNIFNVEKLNQQIKADDLIFYLSDHPEEIMETWKKFNAQERLDKAFSFMNLFVFLQEFDSIHKLELSLNELGKLISSDVKPTIEALQQHLFSNDNNWEAFLITLYFISSGVKKQQLINLSMNLISHLDKFDHLNSSALDWLISDKLFKNSEIEHNVLNEMMQTLRVAIDSKILWDDAFIKKIYFNYVNGLLDTNDSLFNDAYKLGLSHYLLDEKFFIEEKYLTKQYLYKDQLTWLLSIETSRRKAITLLNDSSQLEILNYQLNRIEYLSPQIVKKVKFELYSNILNLESDKDKVTYAANGMLKVGGAYDNLMASSQLEDTTLYNYYETTLIENTIKFKSKSTNNYWYHQALLLRRSSEPKRLAFLQDLYRQISNDLSAGDELLRLIRLFFSELLWNIEEGLELESLSINGMAISEFIAELILMNDEAAEYSQIFEHYLKLVSDPTPPETLLLNEFLEENIDFETKDRLKDILKVKENNKIKISDAKKQIKQAMLYPYTLVMIYSCQAYISTRQKVIRDTWLKRAKELGIECLFVVGGSDTSRLQDDMMYLTVDDTYERLPQKSIEMFRFAHEQFSYERFLKIDDDCFLNIDAYFSDDALFCADYYGRLTTRTIGGTDRIWHQKKSKTLEAKNAIDLSPEPSWYADGSTGYVLSRLACEQLVDAYKDEANRQLVGSSFLEDKLVGDLLVGRGFKVDSTNFTSIVYRKATDELDVTFWEYNLLPKKDNAVKILHCETEQLLQHTWDSFFDQEILNKRYFSNRATDNFLSYGSNEQPFIEEVDMKYGELKNAKHIGVMVCKNELFHLPKLLEHHRAIGIEHFIYIDNVSDDGSIEFMLKQKDVSTFVTTQSYKNSRFGVNWMEAALANFCIGKWVLVIDADELFIYDDFENISIATLTSYAEKHGYDSFLSPMVDMYNKGALSVANIENILPYEVCNYFDNISTMSVQNKKAYGPFSNSEVSSGGLRARVFGRYNTAPTYSYLNQKYCLFKYNPTHKFIEGIHFMGNNNPAPIRATLLHFKYHTGFYSNVHEQILSGQHWNGSQEYKRYLSKLEHNDDLSLYDENVSLQYEGSHSLVEAGYMDKIQ